MAPNQDHHDPSDVRLSFSAKQPGVFGSISEGCWRREDSLESNRQLGLGEVRGAPWPSSTRRAVPEWVELHGPRCVLGHAVPVLHATHRRAART
jgi:hypothetical protein